MSPTAQIIYALLMSYFITLNLSTLGFIEYEKQSGIRAAVGLYLCNQIVQVHGGRLDASDTGAGVRFSMVVAR